MGGKLSPSCFLGACTVDEDGEVKTTYAEKSFAGHHGARRKYEEYFAAKERAAELVAAHDATAPQRAELRALRKRHLDRAMMLAKKMANPPKIERDKDIDFGEPEPGSDDPAGWWRLPPPGEDRDKALKAHANTVRAMEGKDEWWRVRLPEDACGPPIDIRDVCPPNAVCKSNLQPDFNVRVFECFDTSTSAVLRELAESNRFVQKSAESTSI